MLQYYLAAALITPVHSYYITGALQCWHRHQHAPWSAGRVRCNSATPCTCRGMHTCTAAPSPEPHTLGTASQVMLACLPFLAGVGRIAGRLTATMSAKSSEAYAASSALAEQMLGNIRTVAAYHQEDQALEDYRQSLQIPLMVSSSAGSLSSSLGSCCVASASPEAAADVCNAGVVLGWCMAGARLMQHSSLPSACTTCVAECTVHAMRTCCSRSASSPLSGPASGQQQ